MPRIIAVDWDGTLVDKDQEWQPGAVTTVQRWLIDGDHVVIHTCRANWPEGRTHIRQMLEQAHLGHPDVTVVGKPAADVYVDNLAVRHDGDWHATRLNVEAGTSPRPRPSRPSPDLVRSIVGPAVRPTRPTIPRRAYK